MDGWMEGGRDGARGREGGSCRLVLKDIIRAQSLSLSLSLSNSLITCEFTKSFIFKSQIQVEDTRGR